MSSRTGKGPAVKSYRRKKTVLDIDLNLPGDPNRVLAGENRELEGPSTQLGPQEVQADQQPQITQPAMIDVEAIDDDVVECTPRAFAEAKNNSRRVRGRTIVDVDLEDQTRVTNNNRHKRRRESPNQMIINCDMYINLEGSSSSTKEDVKKQPEPPKQPVFNCPICMGPLVEEMSTRCGHIFCKNCIKAAISVQGKCPTCRKKVTVKELIRVFLPSAS
ncbi:E3 ubiquitin-protein ligase RNF4-like [Abrus precatorius]|uniref:E3 ubiquitin-protein ligase RNF4-like n=1 Tax=Abrus precatorius TaxID=3816 RepID=A0A8B8LG05_ABRPR|nr:E3 ubiquitin-protein ligase RNF4-like [Abrus precatorius]XP_027355053.1 E3 ubiquitin-protein ligase RNF4-like [Abrus precatorius]XP_027355054.1 E3 ubiquitin-protein ligase RNF4-like [Abrus precatorius]